MQTQTDERNRREAVMAAGVVVTAEDIDAGIAKVSAHRASNISAPNIPNIKVCAHVAHLGYIGYSWHNSGRMLAVWLT